LVGIARANEAQQAEVPTLGTEMPSLNVPEPIPLPPVESKAPEAPQALPPVDATESKVVIKLPPVESTPAESALAEEALPLPDGEPTTPKFPPVELPPALPPTCCPTTGDKLTLAEVEAMALAFHPALREAEGRINAARGNWVQVGLRPNPVIGYMGNEIGNEGTAGQQGAYISQEFVTANKRGLNRAVASRQQAAAEQRLEMTRLQVITTARIYYFEYLAAERAVALARQLNEVATQSLNVSELRLKALDIPRFSLLQSEIESESAALLVQQADQRHQAALRRLATAVGLCDKPPTQFEDAFARPLPALDWETMRYRVVTQSPELSELHFEVERAKMAIERAMAGRVPNVTLMAGAMHDNANDEEMANAQASMPLPIFDRNQGATAEATGQLVAAQAALDNKRLALEQQLAAALRDYETARVRVARYAEKVLPAARESLDIINTGYKERELEYIQVLTAQQVYFEKNLAYLQDLETAWKKWAEIEGLMVGPLADSADDAAGMPLVR
jgi:cobalt-zinc-cadmium efflux system outer membrane protein